MIFNSIDFAVFLPIVFFVYWFVLGRSRKGQNIFMVVASYFFYGYWDARFLVLIAFSTLLDFSLGLQMEKSDSQKKRKWLLVISLCFNLGLLGFFKYFNFFVDSFSSAFTFLGYEFSGIFIDVILPVGISFYTFQTLSYSLDVYHKDIKATNNITEFSAYVSFFPQLVAGPIERASDFLPQFQKDRTFNLSLAANGMRQILWGLMKKVLIADNAATIANEIFYNHNQHGGPVLFLGAIFFAFQIYGDFSGYSDIAIGTSRLFGFNLKMNFNYPYFAQNIADFWRRWHISLNTWFRDYVYIPMGGNRVSWFKKIFNIISVFLLSGLWHGANWTYVAWGGINGLYFIPSQIIDKRKKRISQNGLITYIFKLLKIVITFILTCFAWIFFRADSIEQALEIVATIKNDIDQKSAYVELINTLHWDITYRVPIIIIVFVLIEWFCQKFTFPLEGVQKIRSKILRYIIYVIVILIIFFQGNFGERIEFIYFQF